MEFPAKTARAYNGNCMGCKRFKRDIMLSFTDGKDGGFVDIFLTTEQAVELVKEIQDRLIQNDAALRAS